MTAEERQNRITEHLKKVEFASLVDLAALVDTSISTVRRDVDALSNAGFVRRTHGGARVVGPQTEELFAVRDPQQLAEKEAIGQACAELVLHNQTVIIDAGTTCYHVARYLESKNPHIITNSLPVANLFSAAPKLEVVVTGGVIYPKLGVLVGPLAVTAFSQVHADFAIMSCGGITADGITNSHGLLIEIQRAMMQSAQRVILCVDHTKFGRLSISQLCGLDALDTVITDRAPSAEMQAALQNAGVELIAASPEGPKLVVETRPPIARSRPRMRKVVTEAATPAEDNDAFLD